MSTLEISGVHAGYGRTEILFDVDLRVAPGQFVTLLGRNGMGKTTLVKVLSGLLPMRSGTSTFNGQGLGRLSAHQIARLGLGLVPEGRLVCPNLTVRENLIATARSAVDTTAAAHAPFNRLLPWRKPRRPAAQAWGLEDVYRLFPRLEERANNLGFQLSGGEQQLLAIGRALMTNPSLLILDEATEGLAPLIRDQVWQCLDTLRQRGLAVLLIDKNIDVLSRIADHHYVIEKGRIVWQGDKAAFLAQRNELEQYLGI